MEEVISIIVPIYKVEDYLEECVESIIRQTYKNLQIVLVNDGSPDGCGEIINNYSRVDSRIMAVHKENGGLSSARNEGMKYAIGEYIAFIDSDDVLEDEFIETMYKLLKHDCSDIAACAFDCFTKEIPQYRKKEYSVRRYSRKEVVFEMYKRESIGWNAWNKLYKRSLFEGIQYPNGLVCEDKDTTYKVYLKADQISYIDKPLYHYRLRGNSISGERSVKYYTDSILVNNRMEEYYSQIGFSEAVRLAKAYSAKCAFLIYAEVQKKTEYKEVSSLCINELCKKYRFIKHATFIGNVEKLIIRLSGASATTRTKIVLRTFASITRFIKKRHRQRAVINVN